VRDTRLQRKCFEQLLYNKSYKKRMSHLHKMLFQRIALRRLTDTTRFVHVVVCLVACRCVRYACMSEYTFYIVREHILYELSTV